MRKRWIIATLCVAALLLSGRTCRREVQSVFYEAREVQRGDLIEVLRETGTLTSKDPVLVKNNFLATLKWVVEDGAWVEKDETVFVVNADKTIEEVGRKRLELIALRQELRLAEMQKEHTEETERLKLSSASRRHELEKLRHRILIAQPVGGRELIAIHEQLLPLEEETRKRRLDYEKSLDAYLVAQDEFLEAQDAYESMKNNMLRSQAEIDKLKVETERDPEVMQPHDREKHEERLADLERARAQYASAQTNLPPLSVSMSAAREASRLLAGPLQELKEHLDEGEAKTGELYIRLEIEKRGLPLARLQLDEEAAVLRVAESARRLADAEALFESGVISKSSLGVLRNEKAALDNQLEIIRQRIKIESRPPAPEELEEARTRLAKAEAEAASAEEAYAQAVAMKQAQVEITRAKIQKIAREIDYGARNFAELIESNIETARRELETLDAEDASREEELQEELVRLGEQLIAAKANPPHIYKASVSGLVRLKQYGGRNRPTQAGDEWAEEDAVVMIYPPGNLEVTTQVNEVNLRRVRAGMQASVIVPSLGDRRFGGDVYQVAGIAKDKFERRNTRWFQEQVFADVTQFEVLVRLDEIHPDLKQGMNVVVELAGEHRADVLWLPAEAVLERDGRFLVCPDKRDRSETVEILGEYFGESAFIVTNGLDQGDIVWLERRRNQ